MKLPRLDRSTGIYIIICVANQKFYIGSAQRLSNRFAQHRGGLVRGIHDNIHLQRSWNKYGEDAFVFGVLEHCEPHELLEREQHYIDRYRAGDPMVGFNIHPIAGSARGRKATPEARASLCAARQRDKATRIKHHIDISGKTFEIVSPQGGVFKTKGLTEFARKHGLSRSALSNVVSGKRPTVMGWHLPETILPTDRRLRDPNGGIHVVPYGHVAAFCRQHGLNQGDINRVALGKAHSYKGWTRMED